MLAAATRDSEPSAMMNGSFAAHTPPEMPSARWINEPEANEAAPKIDHEASHWA